VSEILRDPAECERHSSSRCSVVGAEKSAVRQQKETPGRTSGMYFIPITPIERPESARRKKKGVQVLATWDVGSRRIQPYRSVLQPSRRKKKKADRSSACSGFRGPNRSARFLKEPPTSICLRRMSRTVAHAEQRAGPCLLHTAADTCRSDPLARESRRHGRQRTVR
jgi:hypothetical protein